MAALHSTAAPCERIFFVIDALDECQDLARTTLLKELFNLQTKIGANSFATSRINDGISGRFDGCATLEISASNEDVLAYLNGQLSLQRSSVINEDIQEKIRDVVLKTAGGSFTSAVSQIDTIMYQPTRENIEVVLLGMGRPQEFYKQAMERIEGQPDDIRSLAKRTLTWITRAKRPLSITEIRQALAVREHMTEFDSDYMPDVKVLKSACAGLVTTDEKSEKIRLVHHSTQEFLQQSQEKWFLEGESYIAKICLTYLSFYTFDGALCQTAKEIEDRLEFNPFYGYAACNWGHHARESSITSQEIMSFLESSVKVEASSQVLTANRYRSLLPFNDQRRATKMTGLHLAAYFGIERAVDSLLQLCNNKDIYGRTPLSWAAENGHLPVVEQLVTTAHVEVDSEDGLCARPLSWAAKEGHTAVVRLLLDKGANPNLQDEAGQASLSYAAMNGHIETVQLLLDRGSKTEFWNEQEQCYEKSPLSHAAEQGHIAIIELLLEAGAGIGSEFIEKYEKTPLIWAILSRHKAAVELLLDGGADVDGKSRSGRSPLSFANDWYRDDIAQLLLDRGAKP